MYAAHILSRFIINILFFIIKEIFEKKGLFLKVLEEIVDPM
jgi:hypothetical protein